MEIERVKTIVAEVGTRPDKEFIPLMLFRGSLGFHRAKAFTSFVLSMKDAHITDGPKMYKIARESSDLMHMEGFHVPPTNLTVHSMFSRMMYSPQFTGMFPGLHEYVRSVSRVFIYEPTRISRFSRHTQRDWRKAPKSDVVYRRPAHQIPEFYPYASAKDKMVAECEMLTAIHALVPKGLPESVRPDVCQDLIVSVLAGVVTVDDLKNDATWYVQQLVKKHPLRYGDLSLDDIRDDRTLAARLGV